MQELKPTMLIELHRLCLRCPLLQVDMQRLRPDPEGAVL